jgi:hypothetical protein
MLPRFVADPPSTGVHAWRPVSKLGLLLYVVPPRVAPLTEKPTVATAERLPP